MTITTQFELNQNIFYLERECALETCTTCEGKRKINVANGKSNWNIKCPECHGKGKTLIVVGYGVAGGKIKEVIMRRGNKRHAYTKYVLHDGRVKSEAALFADVEDAEKQCFILNETIRHDRREK